MGSVGRAKGSDVESASRIPAESCLSSVARRSLISIWTREGIGYASSFYFVDPFTRMRSIGLLTPSFSADGSLLKSHVNGVPAEKRFRQDSLPFA